MNVRKTWDLPNLSSALASSPQAAAGIFGVEYLPGQDTNGAIRITMYEYGDLEIIVGVGAHEIQASVILSPVTDIPQAERFQKALLKGNKLLTLSTFGITEIAGVEHYEIFGQLSSSASIEDVLEEIETLALNAIEAAEMIAAWTADIAAAA